MKNNGIVLAIKTQQLGCQQIFDKLVCFIVVISGLLQLVF
jgi:hypothetical protein